MMKKALSWAAAVFLLLSIAAVGFAEGAMIRASITLRVTQPTQNASAKVGDDLAIEVGVEGVVPAYYQWYFEDAAIEGATERIYNLIGAKTTDSGIYRVDAFNASGKMLLSVDVSVRVVDPNAVPKSGDAALSVSAVGFAFVGSVSLLAFAARRRRKIAA